MNKNKVELLLGPINVPYNAKPAKIRENTVSLVLMVISEKNRILLVHVKKDTMIIMETISTVKNAQFNV